MASQNIVTPWYTATWQQYKIYIFQGGDYTMSGYVQYLPVILDLGVFINPQDSDKIDLF